MNFPNYLLSRLFRRRKIVRLGIIEHVTQPLVAQVMPHVAAEIAHELQLSEVPSGPIEPEPVVAVEAAVELVPEPVIELLPRDPRLEPLALQIIELDGVIKGLHTELVKLVPAEIHRPRGMARPSPAVERALLLVPINENVTVNELRGGEPVPDFRHDLRRAPIFKGTPKAGMTGLTGGPKPRAVSTGVN